MDFPDPSVPSLFPRVSATWKHSPDDFQVDEIWDTGQLGESGEHAVLHIRKREANTHWVARHLARFAGVRDMDVAYMGLKDRHAVTRQYFSVYLGKRPVPQWENFSAEGVEHSEYVGQVSRKLRRGQHLGNRFVIVLRDLEWQDTLAAHLDWIRKHGFPNAFGLQRFGHDNQNLALGADWLTRGGRQRVKQKQALWISAIRSAFFNTQLRERIASGDWSALMPGDEPVAVATACADPGRRACLVPAAELPEGLRPDRQAEGEGQEPAFGPLLRGLHRSGSRRQLRPMVALCPDLSWQREASRLTLSFSLGVGCYASSLLENIFDLQAPAESPSAADDAEESDSGDHA